MARIPLPASWPSLSSSLLAGSLVLGIFFSAAGDARAQTAGQGGSKTAQAKAGAARPRNEPSEAHRAALRRTLELRRQRRANRGQAAGDTGPVGGIVAWPMPPALVIRHTPRTHDEIESFLGMLRR